MSQSNTSQSSQDARLNKRLKDTPIAIVGMASLFANARYLNQFWDLICDKIDAITQVPKSRWNIDDYFDADKSKADKSYCKRGGFIPEVDFNPMEFGLPPNILELTDSAQLLSLVVAKEVLQDANLPADYDRDKIGITLGIGGGQKISQSLNARLQYPVLKKVFKSSGISDDDSEMLIKKFQDQYIHWEENSFPGSLGNVIAGRIANRFDFGGMNCVVDAACAGSLAAMRMALSELVEGRSEMMITGGVCTDNSPYMYMSFSKTPAFTTNETIQPFDIDSKGMMIGEGIGMVALKRLEDAERDGDRIYSVIKGVGASSDGKFKSIYAPRPEGQAKALKRAYDDAGFAPHSVGLIEAHGTGTAAGDVAEFNGLSSVFSDGCDNKQHIALGSVKSQIGHTKSTAGTAGLIKAALALHHKVLPPTINVDKPNPKLAIENSPFYLNTQTRPWLPRPDGTPRRAGISSFGFGGTNFHFVLEEYNQDHQREQGKLTQYRQRAVPQSLLFSGADKGELIASIKQVIDAAHSGASLNVLAKEHAIRPLAAAAPRLGLVAKDCDELITLLSQALAKFGSEARLESDAAASWSLPGGVHYRRHALADAKIAALFAGQGAQYLNMGRELSCHFPEMRQQFMLADQVFAANNKPALSQVVYPKPVFNPDDLKAQEAQLTNTAFAQSAIGAISMGQYQLFCAAGFSADMVAGHSFGELSALCAANVIGLEDYYRLTFERGDAMAAKLDDEIDSGVMHAIIIDKADALTQLEAKLSEFDGVKVANYNSPTQLVIAGPTEACNQAAQALSEAGLKAIKLPVSGAFHTPLVAHAQQPFSDAIDKVKFTKAKRPLYANATGQRLDASAATIKREFKQHMLQSVRFSEQLQAMYDDGARIFVEFGPKNILQKLAETTLKDKSDEICCISLNPNPKGDCDLQLRQAAVQLAVVGVALENLDPYCAAAPEIAAPSPMNIKLSATNYISPATLNKMESALASGQITPQIQIEERIVQVDKPVPAAAMPVATSDIPQITEVEKIVEKNQTQQTAMHDAATPATQASSDAISQFFAAQQQTAELHQQFLTIPQQYGETFNALITAQTQMAAAGLAIPESLLRSMAQFHQHQAQTLQSHSQFLELQAQSNASAIALLQGQSVQQQDQSAQQPVASSQSASQTAPIQPAPVATQAAPVQTLPGQMTRPAVEPTQPLVQTVQASAPVPVQVAVPAPSALGSDKVHQTMLAVVADKTGYPIEMLDLAMDMEADLGIDSIKRVEILGTVQDELPSLPELSPEDLAECRTLGEIVSYMNSKLGADNQAVAQVAPAPVAASPVVTQVTAAPAPSALGSDQMQQKVQQTMLSVVADKTGYPIEMLDLAMDMEADLGIDSIKRVEILGTVQDELPNLPELNPEDLAECRTLGEIVNYMNSKLGANIQSTETQSPEAEPAMTVSQTCLSQDSLSHDQVQQTMLAVVADKTGYPIEMLDLAMDMEADLGIDSIKRVEILGTVQDELPNLPELNPEDLAECRTLGEIVNYMNSKLGSEAQASAVSSPIVTQEQVSQAQISQTQVQQTMLSVVADKTGYPTEMLDLAMDMEADLGIDSIKRVEILGTVQDELPSLPELNPEDLAECRTLGEIIGYMNSKLATGTEEVSCTKSEVQTLAATPAPLVELPPHSEVALKKLEAAKQAERCFAADATLVINDDGHNAGVLAEKLQKRGLKVIVVRQLAGAPQSPLSSDIVWVQLNGRQDADIQAVIAQISSEHGAIHGFIHLQPQTMAQDAGDSLHFGESAFDQVSAAFLWAKHLYPSLTQSADTRRSFITVSRIDGGLGYLKPHSGSELNQAALAGLTKTLSHEWPNVVCRALDIAPQMSATQLSQAIIAELFAENGQPTEVGLSLTPEGEIERTALISADAALKTAKTRLNRTDKILVTGGAKGVTFQCALALAKRCQSHFILAGRSAHLSAEQLPLWAQSLAPSELKAAAIKHLMANGEKPTPKQLDALIWPIASSLEIDAALQAFKAVGASAEYVSLDVSSSDEVKLSLGKLGQISGLIHGAGVLADKHIQDKSLSELNRVYGTKVGGLKALLSQLEIDKLKLVALFSSAAGFYGNSGQSDYAMSNEILNKTALQLAGLNPHAKVMSFNWGPWDGGMVNPALKKMFTERGVYVIPLEAGAELFATQLLTDSGVQLLIGSDMQGNSKQTDKRDSVKKPDADGEQTAARPRSAGQFTPVTFERTVSLSKLPFVEDHCIGGNPVLPTVCALQWMRQAASEQYGDLFAVQNYKLLKGIIFDSEAEQTLVLTLTPAYQESGFVVIEALISCDGRPQYQAKLVPQTCVSGAAELADIQAVVKQTPITDKNALYRDGTLFHGPRLQGLDKVHSFDDLGLMVSCELPTMPQNQPHNQQQNQLQSDCGEFTPSVQYGGTQPFAEDLLLQAMLVWARLKYGAASLPSSIGEFVSLHPLQAGERGMIELKVIKSSHRALVADITLYRENGEPSAIMREAKVTISKNLNDAFMPASKFEVSRV
ncbi:phosphopantetheine-binding protein [Shewanella sp. AS1]|uniref:type I polyketide synthase n=1 Tax=Shewanella sp. AS1 TaxID=2907626 RepID=UPI001F2C1372|nr:type I polyketide synthase [Shewanella sp. AS1]MCE9678138.1 phosphopantetheine-binding protein [Shewanella sp. AS1]